MTAETTERACVQCPHPAVIVDTATGKPWCLGCATDLIRAGDAVTEYTELPGGAAYTDRLKRGTTDTLPFG